MYRDLKMVRIAVIPAYEPDNNLIKVAWEAAAEGFEVIVVDDGSVNGKAVKSGKATAETYNEIFEETGVFAHVIRYSENRGKGYAMKTAFSYIKDNYEERDYTVVVIDSDGQHKVTDARMLTDYAAAHRDTLVLGSRRQSAESPLRSRIGNGITRNVFRFVSGVKIYDTQTGMRAFSGDLMERALMVSGDRYEYEMNMLMDFSRARISMAELPIETIYIDDNAGSHFNPLKDSVRIYGEIFKFSASGIVSFLIDYLIFVCMLALFGTTSRIVIFANVFARVISAVSNYSINRNFVFKGAGVDSMEKDYGRETGFTSAKRYTFLAVCILVMNSALLYLLRILTGADPAILKIGVECIMFFVSFTVQRQFVFAGIKDGSTQGKVPADIEIMTEDEKKKHEEYTVLGIQS